MKIDSYHNKSYMYLFPYALKHFYTDNLHRKHVSLKWHRRHDHTQSHTSIDEYTKLAMEWIIKYRHLISSDMMYLFK